MPRWLLDLGKYGVSNISLYLESDNYWVVERQKSTCHTTRLEIAHMDVLLINEFAIDHNGKCVFKFYQKHDVDIQWWNYFLPNFQCWYIMILNIYEYVVVAVDLHITTQMSESQLNETFRCCNSHCLDLSSCLSHEGQKFLMKSWKEESCIISMQDDFDQLT